MTFEGLQNLEAVNEFYNGGTGSLGSGPGTNLGVSFSNTSLAIIDTDAGGSGNFGNEPSPNTILFFLSGNAATMNVAAGFDTGFSFFYSAIDQGGFVRVYDGLNGTGNVLATLNLDPLGSTPGGGDPNGDFNRWRAVGVEFNGVAKSVDFGGSANFIGFDNVTLRSKTPGGARIPEPSALALLAVGGIGFVSALRRKK
jgi:hypothetical protein